MNKIMFQMQIKHFTKIVFEKVVNVVSDGPFGAFLLFGNNRGIFSTC